MSTINKTPKYKFFYFLLILIVLLIIEISLNLIYKIQNKSFLFERVATPIFVEDDFCCYKNKPNLNYIQSNPEFRTDIITDSDGIRIGKELIKIDSNKKNILILGPSFSFGQGVDYEDTYSFKLQKNFSNYNFKNGSVPGHPPELNLCWYFNNSINYKPDIVIQNIYDSHMLNIPDINNLEKLCKSICKKIDIEVTKTGYLKSNGNLYFNIKAFLKKSSIIFYSWYFYEQYIFEKKTDLKDINKNIGKEFYGDQILNENELVIEYKKYQKIFKKLNTDVKVYFILIPTSFTVSDRYTHRYNLKLDDAIEHRERYKYFAKIMEKNFNSIDLFKSLKKKDSVNQTYYNIDVHFTKYGNQVVFETLKEYFEKEIN